MSNKIILLLIALWLLTAPAHAYKLLECDAGPCHWENWPVPYYINSAGTPDLENEDEIIHKSFARWEQEHQTFCGIDFEYAGTTDINEGKSDGKNVVMWIESDWPFGSAALAVTQCWIGQGQSTMLDCDIMINGQDYQWNIAENAPYGSFDLRSTLTHEIGHFWGLDHSELQHSTMYEYYNPKFDAADLDYDDILGAHDVFCPKTDMPMDDEYEENDSRLTAEDMGNEFELERLSLYDDDWFRFSRKAGLRAKVTIWDDDPDREKVIYLADTGGNILEGADCIGDCAVALGEPLEVTQDVAGNDINEKDFYILVSADFDYNAVLTEFYDIITEQVMPGMEGELYDDDDGIGEGVEICGCDQGGAFGYTGRHDAGILLLALGVALIVALRPRFAGR